MKNEPVMIAQVVAALATIATVFGLELTTEQALAMGTVASLVAGWVARRRVTPVIK